MVPVAVPGFAPKMSPSSLTTMNVSPLNASQNGFATWPVGDDGVVPSDSEQRDHLAQLPVFAVLAIRPRVVGGDPDGASLERHAPGVLQIRIVFRANPS